MFFMIIIQWTIKTTLFKNN